MIQKFGYNAIRKHIKEESDRRYYATDRMTFLVGNTFPKNSCKITGHHNKDQE